jgi:predicted DsbA family dithiol-disulfide isomerase
MAIRTIAALKKSTWVIIDQNQKKDLEANLAEVLSEGLPRPFVVPVYFDYQSQNSWLVMPVSKQLSEKYAVEFSWRGFQLRPDWKPHAPPPAPKEALVHLWKQSRLVAEEFGISLAKTRPPYRFNTRRFHMCTEFARLQGKEMNLIWDLHEAVFGRAEDITDPLVFDKVAEGAGLDVAEMDEAVESGVFEGIIDQHRADAVKAGVFGVPTFVVEDQLIWGRRAMDEVEEALKQTGVPRRGKKS